ncbi:unnamed protein product [Musa hybrid cultivar]
MANSLLLGFLGLAALLLPFGAVAAASSFTSSSAASSIHDLLRAYGLPGGLLPREVDSYTLDRPSGQLEVRLGRPCYARFDGMVLFDSVVRANLTYGGLRALVGVSQEELFLWLPVREILVSDPSSGVILFDIGLAHKQLSLSLFESPPDCSTGEEGEGLSGPRAPLPGDPDVREDGREDGGGEPSKDHPGPRHRLVRRPVAMHRVARRALGCPGHAIARCVGLARPAELQGGDPRLRRRRPRHC